MCVSWTSVEQVQFFFVTLHLIGGSDSLPADGVGLTDDLDMITWDEDPDGQSAQMSCGHQLAQNR